MKLNGCFLLLRLGMTGLVPCSSSSARNWLTIAIARSYVRSGARCRFYNVVDLVNRLDTETRDGRKGQLADHLTRMDFAERFLASPLPHGEDDQVVPIDASARKVSVGRNRRIVDRR